MGRLQDFLNNAKSHFSLHSPLGLWAQEVSRIGDTLTNGSPQYGQSTNGASFSLGANTDVILDVLMNNRGLSYPVINGLNMWQLTVGKTYFLYAAGSLSVIGGNYLISWVNNSNVRLGSTQAGGGTCPTVAYDVGVGSTAMIYSPQTSDGILVHLRTVGASAPPGTVNPRSFTSVVMEIPGG